jgi:hypothetical protein
MVPICTRDSLITNSSARKEPFRLPSLSLGTPLNHLTRLVDAEYIIVWIISLNSINQLIFVMVKCGVLSEARTEMLNIIWKNFESPLVV